MTDYLKKTCPACGQQLRIPKRIGGMLMKCPTCGQAIRSDFRLGGVSKEKGKNVAIEIFELPTTMLEKVQRYFKR